MTSALTTAALAANSGNNLVAYYPLEANFTDAGSNALNLSLGGAGASSHILTGQAAQVPGAAGSTSCDGTTAVYLTKTVAGGSPFQLSAWTMIAWVNYTAAGFVGGRPSNWQIGSQGGLSTVAYSASQDYPAGQTVVSGGVAYLALQNNGPSRSGGAGVVTPGTNPAVWVTCWRTYGAITSTATSPQLSYGSLTPLGLPVMLSLTFDGYRLTNRVNGIVDSWRFIQNVAGAFGTITQTTDGFYLFGTGSATPTGNLWGVGVWSAALGDDDHRAIYRAGIGPTNELASATFMDTVQDAVTPGITASPVVAQCAGDGGDIRAAEGYVLVAGKKYHHGCYAGQQRAATPLALNGSASNAAQLAAIADRSARHADLILRASTRRGHIAKLFWHDGNVLHPTGDPTDSVKLPANTVDTWRQIPQIGEYAMILARYSHASQEHWYVKLAAAAMEWCVACQWGVPTAWMNQYWQNRGTLATPVGTLGGPVAGALTFGAIQPYWDTTGGTASQSWALQAMCVNYLHLRHYCSTQPGAVITPSTLARWEQSIVAAAWYLLSDMGNAGTAANPPQLPDFRDPSTITSPPVNNQWYWANGNYQVRYVNCFYYTYLITGDALWLRYAQWMANYTLYPYGVPLTFAGKWAATTSYSTTGDGMNGPHYVVNAGSAYKCIANIAGSSGNPVPGSDATHWQLIDQGDAAFRQGYGMQFTVAGSDTTAWSDYSGYIGEYHTGAAKGTNGLGPPGPTNGYPGYDGDYTGLQSTDAAYAYQYAKSQSDGMAQWYLRVANVCMNQKGRFPSGGGTNNPQATWFMNPAVVTGGQTFVTPGSYNAGAPTWAVDLTSGQSGGYSTRHSLLDSFRNPHFAISSLTGLRPDISAGMGTAMYFSAVEGQSVGWASQVGYAAGVLGGATGISSYLLAAPGFPAT